MMLWKYFIVLKGGYEDNHTIYADPFYMDSSGDFGRQSNVQFRNRPLLAISFD